MIRFIGTRNGKRLIGFVLEPKNLARFHATGDAIVVDLGTLVRELAGTEVLIGYAQDFDAFSRHITQQAVDDGATVHVISQASTRPQ